MDELRRLRVENEDLRKRLDAFVAQTVGPNAEVLASHGEFEPRNSINVLGSELRRSINILSWINQGESVVVIDADELRKLACVVTSESDTLPPGGSRPPVQQGAVPQPVVESQPAAFSTEGVSRET